MFFDTLELLDTKTGYVIVLLCWQLQILRLLNYYKGFLNRVRHRFLTFLFLILLLTETFHRAR